MYVSMYVRAYVFMLYVCMCVHDIHVIHMHICMYMGALLCTHTCHTYAYMYVYGCFAMYTYITYMSYICIYVCIWVLCYVQNAYI